MFIRYLYNTYLCNVRTSLAVLFIFLFTLIACNQKQEPVQTENDSVFSADSMVMIMVDMYITESMIRAQERIHKNKQYYTQNYYSLLFEKYHCDTVKISRSFAFYTTQPEALKEISKKAVDSLVIIETMMQKPQP